MPQCTPHSLHAKFLTLASRCAGWGCSFFSTTLLNGIHGHAHVPTSKFEFYSASINQEYVFSEEAINVKIYSQIYKRFHKRGPPKEQPKLPPPVVSECPFIPDSTRANASQHLLDPCREADDWEEESVRVEILKHALDGLSIDPEGDTRCSQVQTAAHYILWSQDVLVHRSNCPWDTACLRQTYSCKWPLRKHVSQTQEHIFHSAAHTLGEGIVPAGFWFCLDITWLYSRVTAHLNMLMQAQIFTQTLSLSPLTHQTRGGVHQIRTSTGHLQPHCPPSPLLLRDRARILWCWPSQLSDGRVRWSQSGPPDRSSAHSTTSYTELSLHLPQGRCLVSY